MNQEKDDLAKVDAELQHCMLTIFEALEDHSTLEYCEPESMGLDVERPWAGFVLQVQDGKYMVQKLRYVSFSEHMRLHTSGPDSADEWSDHREM